MHDIELLEKQWKRYQVKKYFPLIIGITILLITGMVFSILPDSESSDDAKPNKFNGAMNAIEPAISAQQINTLALDKEKESNISKSKEKISNAADINRSANIAASNISANLSSKNIPATPDEQNREKVKINLEHTTDIDSLIDIMSRFYESKDPNDSLFLAISYYERHDYSKAFYWAIETNKITEDIEESWMIMAKSKAKMGDRNEALRILRAYAAKKDSKAALNLIEQIETNQW